MTNLSQINALPSAESRFQRIPPSDVSALNPEANNESNPPPPLLPTSRLEQNPDLLVTAVKCGRLDVSVAYVRRLKNDDRPTMVRENASIIAQHRLLYKRMAGIEENNRKAYYDETRSELDERMKNLVSTLENK